MCVEPGTRSGTANRVDITFAVRNHLIALSVEWRLRISVPPTRNELRASARLPWCTLVSTESGEVQLRTLDDGQLLRRGSIHMLTNE